MPAPAQMNGSTVLGHEERNAQAERWPLPACRLHLRVRTPARSGAECSVLKQVVAGLLEPICDILPRPAVAIATQAALTAATPPVW